MTNTQQLSYLARIFARLPSQIYQFHFLPILSAMNSQILNDLQSKISETLKQGPLLDLEKNLKALLTSGFSKLDLVTREEFDVQSQVLLKTREKVDILSQRVAELEAKLSAQADIHTEK